MLAVMRAKDFDEALALAPVHTLPLTGAVFTQP